MDCEYWVFIFPNGANRTDAINGTVECPRIEVQGADSDDAVVEAFGPMAARIYHRTRGLIFKAVA